MFHFPIYIYQCISCLLYTSDAADEARGVDHGARRVVQKKITTILHITLPTHTTLFLTIISLYLFHSLYHILPLSTPLAHLFFPCSFRD
ncbi:hypothetical protein PVA38_10365 [Streptococcus pneumoniae D39]|nr:hypothetical protein PVA38_10365 [Streptococcus pneumoniae D39]